MMGDGEITTPKKDQWWRRMDNGEDWGPGGDLNTAEELVEWVERRKVSVYPVTVPNMVEERWVAQITIWGDQIKIKGEYAESYKGAVNTLRRALVAHGIAVFGALD